MGAQVHAAAKLQKKNSVQESKHAVIKPAINMVSRLKK